MTQPGTSEQRINELITHRRRVAELRTAITDIRMARAAAVTLIGFALALIATLAVITFRTWERINMAEPNLFGFLVAAGSVVAGISIYAAGGRTASVAEQREQAGRAGRLGVESDSRNLVDLRLELELEEQSQLLAAAYVTPPAYERQYTYRSRIPAEIDRLRVGGRRYRRWHNFLQWLLILCSAAIPAVTALYEAPQPGKGILIGLGATVAATTSVMGYYKFRERSFNLQQTADSIEQHLTALDIAIAPYHDSDEKRNMERFAETVESLRDEQRKREQQLDQPHTGQQDS